MRILYIVFNSVGKGTYWRALYFGRSLAAQGHAVTLMTTSAIARGRLAERWVDGVQQIEIPDRLAGARGSGWDVWGTLRRVAWLTGRRFDLVHAFETRPSVLVPALRAQAQGARLVMDWADWFGRGGSVEERPNALLRSVLRPLETFFEDRFRTRAHGTTVINRFLGQRAMTLGVPPGKILLLRNGAHSDLPIQDQKVARQSLGLPEHAPILGYVGGIYPRDADFMARAFTLVRQAKPDARLLLIGYFNRDLEHILGDSTGIMRTGTVSAEAMHAYLTTVDICWLPLRDSGANRGRWPMKLSDYLAAGRPVVATHVGDLKEVISAGRFGEVTPDDPRAFSNRTLALLDDPACRELFGAAARRAAEGEFAWDRLTADLLRFYQSLLHY